MKSINVIRKTYVMVFIATAGLFVFFWPNIQIVSINNSSNNILLAKGLPLLNVKNKVCYVDLNDHRANFNKTTDLNIIYYVTPTYPRPEQAPELTRLAHTLMHVPRIHWIIADDQPICSDVVIDILKRSGLPFTHISSPKPYTYSGTNFPRGVANRRAALSWLRENAESGVLYFGDDDNTVDLRLFDEIRSTKKVSMFPVGLIGEYGVSAPVVKDGKVVAFFDSWPGARTFPVDMAGFAVNLRFLRPAASMPYIAGHEEDRFLVSLGLTLDDIEPLAGNCSEVLVWHTKTVKYKKPSLRLEVDRVEGLRSYRGFARLLREARRLGLADAGADGASRAYLVRDRTQRDALATLLAH